MRIGIIDGGINGVMTQLHRLLADTKFAYSSETALCPKPIACSNAELQYLLKGYNYYFSPALGKHETDSFAGVRPLIRSHRDASRAIREYAVERVDRLMSVFGVNGLQLAR